MPTSPLSADRVAATAASLGMDLSDAEAERFAERVNEELPGYAALDGFAGDEADRDVALRDVRYDPGPDDDPLNAFITRCTVEGADDGPLSGLDVAVKDNVALAGVPLTCGSRVFEGVVPGSNASVADRLLDAGARIVGKTNMDELAYGPTSETSQFGPVRNPADEARVAGGSSSGSAAAVAAGGGSGSYSGSAAVDAALGSDTGGSVRIPASFCGVVGFKPTWGAVPRDGFVDLAYTLDHIGPLARDVETAALVFDAVAGYDPRDPSSALAREIPVGECAASLSDAPEVGDLSLGVPEELFADHVSAPVRERVEGVVKSLAAAGAEIERVSLPTVPESVYVWNAITNTELAAAFRRYGIPIERPGPFDSVRTDGMAAAIRGSGVGFGDVVREKTILGSHLLDRYGGRHYVRARNACARLREEFAAALDGRDALVSPTMPVVAPELGAWQAHSYGASDDGIDVPLAYNTRPANLAGVPAISVPAGEVDGLPIGVQFVGERSDDAHLLRVARTFERFIEGS